MDIKIVNNSYPMKDREGWYNWEIHIEPEIVYPYIQYVEYTLDATFKDPIRKIRKMQGGFMLKSSGWGEFKIKVQIALNDGRKITKYHWLNLGGPTPLDEVIS